MRCYIIVLFMTFFLLAAASSAGFDTMSPSSWTAVCGAPDGGEDGVQGGGDPPWGNKCDLKVSCKKCYYSSSYCNSCQSNQYYQLCGTPAEELCANGSAIANCGKRLYHQKTDGGDACNDCHGTGKERGGTCNKNACSADLVNPDDKK